MALMAWSANTHLGEATKRWHKSKILRNKNYNMTVAMGADKHCAAIQLTLQVESAAKQNTVCKNTFVENFAKSIQMHA